MSADHGLSPAPADAFQHEGVVAEQAPLTAGGARWAIVVARWNAGITDALFRGAVDTLLAAGAKPDRIRAVSVPGVVELSIATRELAETSHYAGIIALGCVIRGDTSHFDYVCNHVTDGTLRVQLDHGVPVGFGVITCDTLAQAQARCERTPGGHNVGAEAAAAAIEVAAVVRDIRSS